MNAFLQLELEMGLQGATETTTEEGGDPYFCGSEGGGGGGAFSPDPDPSFEKKSDPATFT